MGDRLRAGKLSRYVNSHPGQVSLAIPLWVGEMSTSLGWEGNRRSGVTLAMRHRKLWVIHLRAQQPSDYGPPLPLPLQVQCSAIKTKMCVHKFKG